MRPAGTPLTNPLTGDSEFRGWSHESTTRCRTDYAGRTYDELTKKKVAYFERGECGFLAVEGNGSDFFLPMSAVELIELRNELVTHGNKLLRECEEENKPSSS
jgi:hypothetical protein